MNSAITAYEFAEKAHGAQLYGTEPYMVHLREVVGVLEEYGYTTTPHRRNLEPTVSAIGYLHDVLEDTVTTKQQLIDVFGSYIADCVELVTDPKGGNRKERKLLANQKLRAINSPGPYTVALIVKAADRLANLRRSEIAWENGDQGKLKMYRKEHTEFLQAAFRLGLCDNIWLEMDSIFEGSGVNWMKLD